MYFAHGVQLVLCGILGIEKMKKIFCRQEVLVKDPTAGIPFVAKTEITGIANKKK